MNVGFRIPSAVEAEPAERTFDVRQYLHFVWRHWMFIASVTALAFVIGVVYLARTTPLYTATAQVLLERAVVAQAGEAARCRGVGGGKGLLSGEGLLVGEHLVVGLGVDDSRCNSRPCLTI